MGGGSGVGIRVFAVSWEWRNQINVEIMKVPPSNSFSWIFVGRWDPTI